jgi:hypothetical protein
MMIWQTIVVVIEVIQSVICAALVFSFIPIPAKPFVQKLFPIYLSDVRPEREMFLYRFAVFFGIGLQALLIFVFRKNLSEKAFERKLALFSLVSGGWVFLQLFALFKILLWGNPLWAKVLFAVALVGAVLTKIFWTEFLQLCEKLFGYLSRRPVLPWSWAFDISALAVLAVLIIPRHLSDVLGRMFTRDQFYHTDGFFMTAAWGHLKGLALNQDVISQYSVLLSIFVAEFLKHTVGFDYPGAVGLVIGMSLLYYAGLYFLLKQWLASRALAFFGILLVIKLQMFHWGVAPLVWQFPTATPMRYFPDIAFMFLLWRHSQTLEKRWLKMLAATVGFTLCWSIDVGVYLTATLIAYLTLGHLYKGLKIRSFVKELAIVLFTAIGVALCIHLLLQPKAFFHFSYWHNQFEHIVLFANGWGAMPMTEGLKEKQFFAFIAGFAIPIFYVFTLIYVGALCFLRRIDFKNIFLVMVSLYGLLLYHYFIHRSGVTSYWAVCVPFVMVVCFWLKSLIQDFDMSKRRVASILLLVGIMGALMTSYWFTYYPNVFNLAGLNWKPEQEFYRQGFDFRVDAKLIKDKTSPSERVALVSSFETKILMQADRAPFFYYVPLVESAHTNDTEIRKTYLHTYGRIEKTLRQLKSSPPAYVFIEKKLLTPTNQKGLSAILDYIKGHYESEQEGQYLAAYRRKDR